MAPHKKIALLGSTGSIGTQTLDIIAEYPDLFSVEVLIAGSNVDLLIQQAIKHKPKYAIIANENLFSQLRDALAPLGINVAAGKKAICDAVDSIAEEIVALGEETLESLAEETPLGRIGTPEDVAEAVLFLASSRASFITGETLSVGGGFAL